ncbi:MAG: alpha-1,4-glucan--maltose-1-phosphate maltosyltransferase [Actinomycetota bacterium]|nr:alpha-1,4-glucan--maltose-1-phosphate maltosyltransferase [Actinomycetota bacterium]
MLGHIIIDDVRPRTPDGYPPKVVDGERIRVSADLIKDGHDELGAVVRLRRGPQLIASAPLHEVVNDLWEGELEVSGLGAHELEIVAWTDRFATWRHHIEVKAAAGQDVLVELEVGARFLEELVGDVSPAGQARVRDAIETMRNETCSLDVRLNAALDDAVVELIAPVVPDWDRTSRTVPLWIDRPLGGFSAWYELFPRSEGGFAGAVKRLDAIADMGFDIVYLPPIHPIGRSFRKGPNNTLDAGPDDPGSPWAIGGAEGGHLAIHPELGDHGDFVRLVDETRARGMEIALDYALQCSPDHPWVHAHPEWFTQLPDGSIRYAENPPKKYQDIYPINFWPERETDRIALWHACKEILDHWIAAGVRVFRVDNPHTKPLAFWEWVIGEVRASHPDVLFLAEAFTRPKMMAKLAEVGFTQSYSYFTWRYSDAEFREYLTELSTTDVVDYMRPNFWPNTPDILEGVLRNGPPAAFAMRLVLAATMTPNYGMYSGYELFENQPAADHNTEYLNSEKYQIVERDWSRTDTLVPLITQINAIRRRHPAFQQLRTIRFHGSDNGAILAYSKTTPEGGDPVLVVVNLDFDNPQAATLDLDLGELGMPWGDPYTVHDEISGETYTWQGNRPWVRLDPARYPAHVLALRA